MPRPDPTPKQLIEATWIPYPAPEDAEEFLQPIAVKGRVLTVVKSDEGFFVVARKDDVITESWKVLL